MIIFKNPWVRILFINMDEKYMQRCLQLAKIGLGNTYPNPMVGSVIVHGGKIIGEGFHHKAGEAHAEVNAIRSVHNKELLKESTLYVNLEPCAHYGKTPPCALLIQQSGIPRVVIGCTDSFSQVAGKGISLLRDAGVDVTVGLLEKESRELNKRFFTFHEKRRPYIILKWAQTLDGFIDVNRSRDNYGQPTWITNNISKKLVHKWRSQEQAILVGVKTALKDNPSLTTREWAGQSPVRILIDRHGIIPKSFRILNGEVPSIVFTAKKRTDEKNIRYVPISLTQDLVPQILNALYEFNLQSLIVEGGRQVLQSFIDANYWDEAHLFVGHKMFVSGVKAPKISGSIMLEEKLDDTRLFYYRNYMAR
ncbi:diaminohydroxyphosphoribosylaminopyrimidine deaminase [Saccharicrinis carchari]|uniref:Riboflavin biosynthesis protein RibD n=1 Tax=Saccharicrinis carchari TaxID=1168039 RepID=A0A521CJ07_SACCC|nr:bifunctional diaminohydroxyphosphoribosylaminopyrimidine deaminase/5-amino-6-(5-phosphoribosylamino)uracil reductase RibD [Saccharicrinis carchari]SMO59453.1 diaminohydroxyphosphoribosylaminopyrimidine deaminase [Saccharicrinis carchari]